MTGVVEHLHLRPGVVRLLSFLGDPVEDAAVAAWLHLPLEQQLEVAELVGGDEIPAPANARDRAINHTPAVGNVGPFKTAPSGGGRAIEQRAPPRGALLGRQRR